MLVWHRVAGGLVCYRVERTRKAALSPRLVVRAMHRRPVLVTRPPGMAWHEVDAIHNRWQAILAQSHHWLEPWFSKG
jgi:hypothetical protein